MVMAHRAHSTTENAGMTCPRVSHQPAVPKFSADTKVTRAWWRCFLRRAVSIPLVSDPLPVPHLRQVRRVGTAT